MGGLEEHDFVHRIGGEERTTHYVAAGPKDGPLLVFVHGCESSAMVSSRYAATASRCSHTAHVTL